MGKKKNFFMSAAVIAFAGIFLRCVAISFNAYVSAKIGSESMGLFTLVMSVYGLAVTVATSGVNLAAVRLTAERTAHLTENGADKRIYRKTVGAVLRSCVIYGLAFSLASCVILYLFAPVIGKYLLFDVRTVKSLRLIAVSLPAISVSSAMSGCFTGLRKGYKNALSAVFEQFCKIMIISTALSLSFRLGNDRVEYLCFAVVGGGAVSEALSLAFNTLLYLTDSKRPPGSRLVAAGGKMKKAGFSDAANIAFPVALGAYARQGLSTTEHLAIPWGLKKSGLSGSSALVSYGNLLGMAFPLVLFPSVVLTSAAGLLIPEFAEMRELGNVKSERKLVSRALITSILFSVGVGFILYIFGEFLGVSVYSSPEVGHFIKTIAPLVPIMYTDTVTDCILKGLGEQKATMKINVIDASVSLAFAFVLVPLGGINGYIVSVYICEILNFILSFVKLRKCTYIDKTVLTSAAFSLFAGLFVNFIFELFRADTDASGILLFSGVYALISVIYVRAVNNWLKSCGNIKKSC